MTDSTKKASLSPPKEEDFILPKLSPLLKLFQTSPDQDGSPRWTLHLPASNQYFQIRWIEFECLARFQKCTSAQELIHLVNGETTLNIDMDDVKTLISFLQQNHLLIPDHNFPPQPEKPKSFLSRLVHGYLFFTIPLFKPARFLQATLPYMRPFLSQTFLFLICIIFAVLVSMTIQRFDEFTHTFLDMLSVKGAILTLLTFTAIKIIHELGHAYVATKYGVTVPHMGVAFIVMYPVLYTETTSSWRLASPKHRMKIGLAGVAAELVLATIFLALWHILPPGLMRSLSFSVVAISLLGSLFINLNPLMRFDGYFVLSDLLGIENLHQRAITLARWSLRRFLFGIDHAAPDHFTAGRQAFMIIFGFIILIYRFFLFLGIAVLVYYVFFKPLGLIMMAIELLWFIGLPIFSELKVWWSLRGEIIASKRSKVTALCCLASLIYIALPLHGTLHVYGVLHPTSYRSIYAPSPAQISALHVNDRQSVIKDQVLAVLRSPALEQELKQARSQLSYLREQKRRERTDISLYREQRGALEEQILLLEQTVRGLLKQQDLLIVRAPFDGVVHDLSPDIHTQRFVTPQDLLFTIAGKDGYTLSAYVPEADIDRIHSGNTAFFQVQSSLLSKERFTIDTIYPTSTKSLRWPELSSVYGGDIPSAQVGENIEPLEPFYQIKLKPLNKKDNYTHNLTFIETGHVRIHAKRQSIFLDITNRFIALIIREIGLN